MSSRAKGIFYMLLSACSFTAMNIFIRLSGDIPSLQKSFFRNLISLFFALIILMKDKVMFQVPEKDWKHLILRSFLGTVGVICNFYAVDHMVLSDATMLNELSPFFTIIFVYLLLREAITLPQMLLFLSAMAGSLLIIKPSFSGFASPAAPVALLGGICAGWAYAEVRLLGMHKVHKSIIILVFSAFSCVTTLPALIFDYSPMSLRQLVLLLCAGLTATGGQFGITTAYSYAAASEISIYDYSQIIFSAAAGYFIFGQLADRLSFLGYVIICASAVVMAIYNQCRESTIKNV